MAEFATDQADGLRKLFGRDSIRIATLTSPDSGVGKSISVANLAVALASAGKNVLVLDENAGEGNVCSLFGLREKPDLLDAGGVGLDQLLVEGPCGISILKAVRRPAGEEMRGMLIDRIGHASHDVLLVDAAPGSPGNLLPSSSQEMIVVLSTEVSSITSAYALIKKMHLSQGTRRFRVLVSRAKNGAEARAIFDNMAQVAMRYLAITLNYMGHVPEDDALRHAVRLKKPVLEAFPMSASGSCFRSMADAMLAWPRLHREDMSLGDFLQHLIRSSRLSEADIGS
ncbi:MAG: P-loop NTPase [Burkholderiales bacterium]|nr:P-loop NTPase [Burkholderiales bacterium]